MSRAPKYWNTAKKYLSEKDKVMLSLINKYRSPSETILTSRRDVFFSLCKSIIGQQISVAAANSVFLKFKNKCKNRINAKSVNELSTTEPVWLISFFFSFSIMILSFFTFYQNWIMPNLIDLFLLSMIGILGGLANLWLSQSYKLSEVSLVSPLKYLALIFAIIFGYFIWDEIPTIKTLLGALLVIFSSFIIFKRELTLKKSVSAARHE